MSEKICIRTDEQKLRPRTFIWVEKEGSARLQMNLEQARSVLVFYLKKKCHNTNWGLCAVKYEQMSEPRSGDGCQSLNSKLIPNSGFVNYFYQHWNYQV